MYRRKAKKLTFQYIRTLQNTWTEKPRTTFEGTAGWVTTERVNKWPRMMDTEDDWMTRQAVPPSVLSSGHSTFSIGAWSWPFTSNWCQDYEWLNELYYSSPIGFMTWCLIKRAYFAWGHDRDAHIQSLFKLLIQRDWSTEENITFRS
jgi:hypothetical protein